MPSERYPVVELPYHVQENIATQPQAKLCAYCHATLVDPSTAFHDNQVICAICRERPPHSNTRDSSYPHRQRSHDSLNISNTRRLPDPILAYDTALTEPPYVSYPKKPPAFACSTIVSVVSAHRRPQPHYVTSYEPNDIASNNRSQQRSTAAAPYPSPLADITRLRIRSYAHQCLYAGAVFQGTQKSGKNSYDVHVTIVDVNFAASSLCGYLRIRGLTDDWPELTTYFDAEIIGSRYGFLTQNLGATRHEDIVHWSRFPAFKHIQHEAKLPHMTIDERDRGVVFMRWKERFLVPDHRVQDINGASFAGFYYVCVDFNPQPSSVQSLPERSSPIPSPQVRDNKLNDPNPRTAQPLDYPSTDARQCRRRDPSFNKRRNVLHAPPTPPVATMSGFYYHQNSEPYQQLSLAHVPEETNSSFEFR